MNVTTNLSRRLLACALACLLAGLMLHATSLTDRAAVAYERELYTEALKLYLQAEREQGVSAALCVNLGDTYFRLKDTPHAILCYERALRLDPSCADARYNLDYVRRRAALPDEAGTSIIGVWAERVLGLATSDGWARTAIATFLLLLAAVALYAFATRVALRKVGFFGAIVLLIATVLANVCAFVAYHRAVRHDTAIVVADRATLGVAPRTPTGDNVAFELVQGRKVWLGDTVRVGESLWRKATTAEGRQAWIDDADIEVI